MDIVESAKFEKAKAITCHWWNIYGDTFVEIIK